MNSKERGEKIRRRIIQDVRDHPADIVKHITQIFGITPQAVNNHIKRLIKENRLGSSGIGKGKRYFLGDVRGHRSAFALSEDFTEDSVWRNQFAFVFEGLPENIFDICHYGFTEMVNNVIDHSDGGFVAISAERDIDHITILVVDDGEGIFKKINRLSNLEDESQALFELHKGKLTTDPDNHTGEGVFFTSRAFDVFEIESKGLRFNHNDQFDFDYLMESDFDGAEVGTLVYMNIKRDSKRDLQTLFDEYAEADEYQFNKTVIPVQLAQYGNEKLVSRSQAKRLLARVDKFKYVIFDFDGVSAIGQAFADEIFRVYAKKHPEILLTQLNMSSNVQKMVSRAVGLKGE